MRRDVLAAGILCVLSLIPGSVTRAEDSSAVGVVRAMDATGTRGTLYLIDVTGSVGRHLPPGTLLAIEDDNLRSTNVRTGDKVRFRFARTGRLVPDATDLALLSIGRAITADVLVGGDITADQEGNLVVNPGEVLTIRNGATVDGNIKVVGDGVLVVTENSLVQGNIRGERGADILIDTAGVDGDVENRKDEDRGGSLAISNASIDGNVSSDRNEFMGIELSHIHGRIESRQTDLTGILDSTVDGSVRSSGDQLVAYDHNVVDGDLKAEKVGAEVVITNNVVDGILKIGKGAPLCTESGNTVTKKNSGCP